MHVVAMCHVAVKWVYVIVLFSGPLLLFCVMALLGVPAMGFYVVDMRDYCVSCVGGHVQNGRVLCSKLWCPMVWCNVLGSNVMT